MTSGRHALHPDSRNLAGPARTDVARAARHAAPTSLTARLDFFCGEDQNVTSGNGEWRNDKDRHKCGGWASADQFEILADPP